jgi:3-phenylpropionate/cinnamic acid dioxygenase small subunit
MEAVPVEPQERLLLYSEITEFLFNEADLLDTRRFREWLDLLTADITYEVPMQLNAQFGEEWRERTRPGSEICWLDESKETLEMRVRQLETGVHWADEPASRVCYLISNIRITGIDVRDVQVSSRFLLYRNRVHGEVDTLVGKRFDTLTKTDGGWRLAKRRVLLDQNVLLAKNLTTFF